MVNLFGENSSPLIAWQVPHRVLFHDVPCRICYFSDLRGASNDLKEQIAKLLCQIASQRCANTKLLCQIASQRCANTKLLCHFSDLRGAINDLKEQIAKLLCQIAKLLCQFGKEAPYFIYPPPCSPLPSSTAWPQNALAPACE